MFTKKIIALKVPADKSLNIKLGLQIIGRSSSGVVWVSVKDPWSSSGVVWVDVKEIRKSLNEEYVVIAKTEKTGPYHVWRSYPMHATIPIYDE